MATKLAKGWSSVGNNLYRNEATGQMVDSYHPIYQQALADTPDDQPPPVAAPTASPAAPAAVPAPPQVTDTTTAPMSDRGPQAFWDPTMRNTSVPPPAAPGVDRPLDPNAGSLGPLTDNGGVATHQPSAPGPDVATGVQPSVDPTAPTAAPPAGVTRNTFLDALLARMSGKTPSINDPELKAQHDAFSLAQTRAKQRNREAMAGRMAQQGYLSDLADSGAFDEGLSNLEQQQGESEAAYDAGLVGNAAQQQRDELYRYAALAGNQLNAEDARALSEKLALLDAQIRREGMTQSGRQFEEGLGENRRQFDASKGEQGREFDIDAELKRLGINTQGDLGRGDLALRARMGDMNAMLALLTLNSNNANFDKDLSARLGMFNSGQSQSFLESLLAALGGQAA